MRWTLFLLSICPDELISATNVITFLPNPLPSVNEKLLRASNPIPYLKCLHLSKSTFLGNLTVPNKKLLNVKSALCLNGHKIS